MKAIFDIGAFDGLDGLMLSMLNKDKIVFAFEANPNLKKKIFTNKKKIEEYFKSKIKNYFLINMAVSNTNKKVHFYILKNSATSSILKPKNNLHSFWKKNKDLSINKIYKSHKIENKVRVKSIKLKDFCEKKKISEISYLHCDTQGNDLNVFKSLGNKYKLINKGVLETIRSSKLSLYHQSSTLEEVKKLFNYWDFTIIKIKEFHKNNPERDVYFINKYFKGDKKIILPTYRQARFFKRIINDKTKAKDFFYRKFLDVFII